MSSESSQHHEARDGMNRRRFIKLSAAAAGGLALGAAGTHWIQRVRQPLSHVAILPARAYADTLAAVVRDGLKLFPDLLRRVKGGRVVLKPNLIEYHDAHRVNTHPMVVAAAIESFRSLDAKEVVVAEGPGHRRDMEMLLAQSGMEDILRDHRVSFVDLNLDAIRPVKLVANYTKLDRLFLPDTVLGADLVVSMPKLKTHHWNPGFAIIDGIEAMEGDGPLRGDTVGTGVIIMGDNLVAVDATGARVMDMRPERIPYLARMLPHGGTIHESRILQLGVPVASVRKTFKLPAGFEALRETAPVLDYIRGL
jgi:uncharacterized protein (DUF362 family)